MASIILPSQHLVLRAFSSLVDLAPGYNAYSEHLNYVSANGEAAYKAALNSTFAGQTNAQLASAMLSNLGLTSVFTQAEGEAYLAANASNRVGAIIDLANALSTYAGPDAALLTAKSNYNAALDYSYTYSIERTNPGSVELTDSRVNTVELTSNSDVKTANIFNAAQVYTPGGDDRINSLQDEDQLTGTGTDSTLNATLGNANDNGGTIITPKLTNVANINVAFSGSGGGTGAVTDLDLQDATGVSAINITRVSQAVNRAEIGNIMSAAPQLSLSNTNANQGGTVDFSYTAGVLAGNQSGAITLSNVNLSGATGQLNIGQNTTGIGVPGVGVQGFETLAIRSTGAANTIGTMNLPMDTGTAGAITITGDQALTLATTANVVQVAGGLVEAVTHGGGIAGNYGRLASVSAADMTAALTLNIAAGMLSTGKADTSGVVQNVTITGSGSNDTFYLQDLVQAGDVIAGGAGTDTLVVYTGGVTTGTASSIESVDIQSNNANVTMDMARVADATLVNIRNIGNAVGVSADSGADALITLNNLTATMGAGLNVQHSTTTNGAIFDTTIQANLASSTNANDVVGISINEGVNADQRFNFTLGTNADVVATAAVERVESITITNNDSESNSVELASAPTHTGTITLNGGTAGTFLNLDVDTLAATVTGLRQTDITGGTADGVATVGTFRDTGWVDVAGAATSVRLVAATIDATNQASDVQVRVSTTAANTNGGQSIRMGAGNDIVIFDDIAVTSLTQSQAGLTNADTVAGGAGNNTLVIDGNGTNVVLQQSEWDNVSGFQTVYLAGNGAGNQYFLQLDNDMIAANGTGGNLIAIDNDDDSLVNNQAAAFHAGATNADFRATNTAVRLDATTLSANMHFSYDGEEGTGATADRFVVNDNNTNGGNIIDGGDVNISVALDGSGVLRQLAGVQSADTLEVRNTATVTTADLSNVRNVGNLVINNDQAVLQTLNLSLDTAVADALSDSGHTASLTEVETLNITANDGAMADAAGTAIAPTAASRIVLDARGISGAFGLTVNGDTAFAANDTIQIALNLGGAAQNFNLALGTDTVSLLGFNANGTDFVTTTVAGNVATLTASNAAGISTQVYTLTSVEALNFLTTAGAAATVAASTITGSVAADTITGSNLADNITGGAGADNITGGAGADTIVQGTGDSVAVSVALANANFAATNVLTFGNGVDVVNGFTAGAGGDVLDLVVAAAAVTGIGVANNTLVAGTNYFLSGTWNAAAGTFTVTADGVGADTVIVQGYAGVGTDIDTNTSAVVLVGVDSDNLVAGNFA